MKPILFNSEMVLAIKRGRKTVTRRLVKPRYRDGEASFAVVFEKHSGKYVRIEYLDEHDCETRYMREPYNRGDILYVRETWAEMPYGFVYKADDEEPEGWDSLDRWRPSIHMPKEAARLFLRVKSIRAEQLQEITNEQALQEGVPDEWPMNEVYCPVCKGEGIVGYFHTKTLGHMSIDCPHCKNAADRFGHLWDSTITQADLDFHGWTANPWVWVIEFEVITKEEAIHYNETD